MIRAAQTSSPTIWRAQPRPRAGFMARAGRAGARIVYLTLCGLVLGAIIHIVTILSVPWLARNDAAARFAELGAEGKAQHIDSIVANDGAGPVVDLDPATAVAACGYDLTEGPMRVTARTGATPLAISILPRGGGVAYAITDRAAIRGVIDFVLLTPAQLADRAGREDDGEAARELRVTLPKMQGLIVARALARRPADRAEADMLVADVICGGAD